MPNFLTIIRWSREKNRYTIGTAKHTLLLKCAHTRSHTWKQRVLYAEHGRPVAVVHGFHDFLLGYVGSSVLDADARLQVVEMASVELKELYEQDPQVGLVAPGVDARVPLIGKG